MQWGGKRGRRLPGWGQNPNIHIIRSVICEPKCYVSGMAPKGRAETANNKEADIRLTAGGTGAERWAPPMSR